ncbi:MAG TPA: amylo-alpha-1,6-glucosidase [Vicinamibacteria bacterium]
MDSKTNPRAEWLEADGLGGFASGTVSGIRSRRYHALLLVATTPPTGRVVLVNGFDAWVTTPAGMFALSSQHYDPGVTHPDGAVRIESFLADPWPQWTYRLEDGTKIEQEIVALHESPLVSISWRLSKPKKGVGLRVRPFLSGRDYHALHHENPGFRFQPVIDGERVRWQPYPGIPEIVSLTNGRYHHQPNWYRNFLYQEEKDRGLDFTEDLASPGELNFDLSEGEGAWILGTGQDQGTMESRSAQELAKRIRAQERKRRMSFPTRLHRAADAYIVRRREGKTIAAGYPWFTDWGRDTFIALRGLSIATGKQDEAAEILLEWAGAVSEGMLPNRFPDRGESPEFNSVDASLWYVIAVHDLLRAAERRKHNRPGSEETTKLLEACEAILEGYRRGTRYGIRSDEDGLLRAGEPGVQLTWMDAKVGDWVVTPRIGKPVEVQALWLNALAFGAENLSGRWNDIYQRGREAFEKRFWNESGGYLYDVVDVEHRPGTADPSFRPNQIFAVGGLPVSLLEGERARRVVDAVENRLWTPLGLRSLAPGEPGYVARYQGGVLERDGAYHQGTVWPWLMGAFVEAWARVRGGSASIKKEARERFLDPLLRQLDTAGVGHLPEIADGDAPHHPRGCPFQAWSVGEALRLDLVVLSSETRASRKPSPVRKTSLPAQPRAYGPR